MKAERTPSDHSELVVEALRDAIGQPRLEVGEDAVESIPLRAAACATLAGAGSTGEGALEDLVAKGGVPPAVRQVSLRALAKVSAARAARVVKVAADLREPWPDRQAAVHVLGSAAA